MKHSYGGFAASATGGGFNLYSGGECPLPQCRWCPYGTHFLFFCIDILGLKERDDLSVEQKSRTRKIVHISITVLFVLLILLYQKIIQASVISTILKVAGYTYGPLWALCLWHTHPQKTQRSHGAPYLPAGSAAVLCAVGTFQRMVGVATAFGFEICWL